MGVREMAFLASKIKISVIVTVHNAEKYLRECLDSVCNQTFGEIEILCIDGGSTDLSPQILEEYIQKDNRIRIINDSNTSYGHKINVGIAQAEGNYIAVLESDDMYMPYMLERLYRVAEKYEPDFVNADYTSFFDVDGKRHELYIDMYQKSSYDRLMENKKHPEKIEQILRYWTGIFKKDFLIRENIQMNESPGASFQDMSFRFLTSILAETSYHLKDSVYLYRVDNPSSSVYDAKKAVVIADEYDFLMNNLKQRSINDKYIWQNFYQWKYRDFYGNLIRFEKSARDLLLERSIEEREQDREDAIRCQQVPFDDITDFMLTASKSAIHLKVEEQYQYIKSREKTLWKLYKRMDKEVFVIFGCGQRGKDILRYFNLDRKNILCYTDNAEKYWNTVQYSIPIFSPVETIKKYPEASYIIANKSHGQEIKEQLLNYGIAEDKMYML